MGCCTSAPAKEKKRASRRKACKFGLNCWRENSEHTTHFSHPGDPDYRRGLVIFADGVEPEFGTLRQLFDFCDPKGHGNFTSRDDLQQAVALMSNYCRGTPPDALSAWQDLVGDSDLHVSFVKFAIWAQAVGVVLPIGVETSDILLDSASNYLSCGFVFPDGRRCECKHFVAQGDPSTSSGVQFCKCHHKRSMHAWRSEDGRRFASAQVPAPFYWPKLERSSDFQGLMKLGSEGIALFQMLFDKTHKTKDNWTRDRGCSLHGVRCPPDQKNCKFHNKAPVPEGYRVVAVMRNMNRYLWGPYALNRGVICKECKTSAGQRFRPIKDVKTMEVLLEEAPMVDSCNEWFLFHGSSPKNCQSIARNNFKLGLAGTGSTWKDPGSSKGTPLYGNGIYFAESVTKADEYSELVESGEPYAGCHALLVCRVIGGRTQWFDTDKIDPAFLQRKVVSGPFHSVFGDRVSKLGKPYREVVVYDAMQCYPEYVVYYERLYSGASKKIEPVALPECKDCAKNEPVVLPNCKDCAKSEPVALPKCKDCVGQHLTECCEEREEQEMEGGVRYRGQWRGDQWHGHGVLRKLDGQRYEGSFENGRAHGHGLFVDKDGNMYDGQWKQDKMQGYGKYSKTDGSAYKGEWYQDEKCGRGAEVFADGGCYEGEFMHGCKNGKGIYRSFLGVVYEGQFLQDRMDGEGCYKFVDGRTHVGQWKQGHMNGLGRMEWPNGSLYEGHYENDKKHGEGTFTWPDGRVYRGQWSGGQQHGIGVTIDPTGDSTQSEWSKGQRIPTISSM